MVKDETKGTLIKAGSTVTTTTVLYLLIDEFLKLPPEWKVITFFVGIILLVAISYASAYIKKYYGIDPVEVAKEIKEIIDLITNMSVTTTDSNTNANNSNTVRK